MFIDNRGKLFGKVNIIDLCVILLIIIAIVATAFKFNFSAHGDVSETDSRIEYEILVKAVRQFSVDSLEKGDSIWDAQNNVCIGEVLDVRTEPATEFITKNNGDVVESELPGKYNMYIKVGADARINDSGIFVGGTKQIIPYQNLDLETQRNKMKGNVTQYLTNN